MKEHTSDIVIIGSGLGGLVSALIFAKEGYSVSVLEKNNQFGGNLQTFVRDKSIFDTGVHYIGGLAEGENLYQYFKYLGIMDDLKLQQMDVDKYDVISFDDDTINYPHAQGYDNFIEQLSRLFPEERTAIETYCNKIKETCNSFPLYNLKIGDAYYGETDLLSLKVKDYIESLTENKKLRAVLVGSNFLYAGEDNTPFYVHALSINSYIQSSWRCVNGGSQISKYLIKKIRSFGGQVLKYKEVVDFGFDQGKLVSAKTKDGNEYFGTQFISNIEPKHTLKMIGENKMRKAYTKRIESIKSVISAFSVYFVFKPETFKYINNNHYHFKDVNRVWDAQNYTEASWPEGYMLSVGAKKNQTKWAENMTFITYMRYDEVEEWADTYNTVSEKEERGEAYEAFKRRKVASVITEIEKKFPDFRACIKSVHSSTPLSYRDYIGVNEGSMYGYVKDAESPMTSFLSPRTKLKNLFFTGQSINMHGILGVTISAVLTCSEMLGREYLIENINKELEKLNIK
ncbi:MAG: phytoene desaturase family protein [Flavobacteriaceae bacterium]|mgnify:CR=1 FL=1